MAPEHVSAGYSNIIHLSWFTSDLCKFNQIYLDLSRTVRLSCRTDYIAIEVLGDYNFTPQMFVGESGKILVTTVFPITATGVLAFVIPAE
ncbi:hypothetical protein CSKR_203584 [Clonorchis sinensis]|uniref:Uncharacterized protein n=1 Tax=Clonorchis sinensis TaxID=79923 RepID=A0A8T1MD08_CLOSI|nr:hypothetical protein CSKR_203584 [Clonorchis sinensis]